MRRRTAAALGLVAALVPAGAAHAGTVNLDHACYVEGDPMLATGSGFTPGAALTLSGNGASATATADASGAFSAQLAAPANPTSGPRPSDIKAYTLNVQNAGDPSQNTSVRYQVANFTADRGTSRDPQAKRTWYFSGFPTGSTIYGHFRFGGRTLANYRFGTATGACGLLHARARGIPVRHLRLGTWRLQLDTHPRYDANSVPRLTQNIVVYVRSQSTGR
jgi:hypothetical protein